MPNKDIFLVKVCSLQNINQKTLDCVLYIKVIKSYNVDTVIVERKVQMEYSLMDTYRSGRMSVEIWLMDKRKNKRTLGMN